MRARNARGSASRGRSADRRSRFAARGIRLFLIVLGLALLVVGLVASGVGGELKTRVESRLYPLKFEEHILRAATAYGVDPYLVAAVAKAESGFEPGAVSPVGAVGLMQIMPETAVWIQQRPDWKGGAVPDLTDPAANLEMGAYYLAYLTQLFAGDLRSTLAAYNAGQGTVTGWLTRSGSETGLQSGDILFTETREFVARVEKLRARFLRAHPGAFVT